MGVGAAYFTPSHTKQSPCDSFSAFLEPAPDFANRVCEPNFLDDFHLDILLNVLDGINHCVFLLKVTSSKQRLLVCEKLGVNLLRICFSLFYRSLL